VCGHRVSTPARWHPQAREQSVGRDGPGPGALEASEALPPRLASAPDSRLSWNSVAFTMAVVVSPYDL
jgi:hypothetical protein